MDDLLDLAPRGAWRAALHAHPELWALVFSGRDDAIATARRRHPGLDALYVRCGPPPGDLARRPTVPFTPPPMPFDERERLSTRQLVDFSRDGYVELRGAISRGLVDGALRSINVAIAEGKIIAEAAGMSGLVPEARAATELLALFYESPLATAVQSLVGRGRVAAVSTSQVALRFPQPERGQAEAVCGTDWHIDGFSGKGQHSPFTLLLGVCLSDTPEPGCGNLALHPGCHRTLQQSVCEEVKSGSQRFSLRRDDRVDVGATGKPDLGPPVQLCLRAGDAVLVHQKTPHLGTPNDSAHIRYMVYFRIRHVGHNALKEKWLEDVMLPFEGVRELEAWSSDVDADAANRY
jgi:ectoine hydroxylase-related dioxygenase (phytanoyl-CoA dioxygenase family)